MSAWFASERWAFARHKGQKWLSDVLSDFYDHVMNNSLVSSSGRLAMAVVRLVQSLSTYFRRFFKAVSKNGRWRSAKQSQQREDDPENCSRSADTVAELNDGEAGKGQIRRRASDATTATKMSELLPSPIILPPNSIGQDDKDTVQTSETDVSISPPVLTGKRRLKAIIKGMKDQSTIPGEKSIPALSPPFASFADTVLDSPQSSSVFGDELPRPLRKRTTSSGPGKNVPERRKTVELPVSARSKLGFMTSKLADLVVKYDLSPHSALVRHMQFSPDGKFLATAGWDKTSVIFRVGVSASYNPAIYTKFLNSFF